MESLRIRTPKGERIIGPGQPAFIVAEMSSNHNQDLERAKRIIDAAAQAGADAIKVQTYTPDTITMDSDKKWFWVGGEENPDSWKQKTFYQLYQKSYLPWDWHAELQTYSEKQGLMFFSTPFDDTAVDFLETLNVPCYKIASYEATHIPLLRKVAKTGKPVIMSVGFATLDEVELSVQTLRDNGVKQLALLHCTTSYSDQPRPEHTNLRTIQDIATRFDVVAGFSDNMGGVDVPVLAAAMGAAIIEKHFVVTHENSALDDRFSLDQRSLKAMVDAIRENEKVMGRVQYGCQTEAEKHNRKFRRSVFAVQDIKKGEKFTSENIRCIRPGDGLETKYYEQVLGVTASQDIERGTPIQWELVGK